MSLINDALKKAQKLHSKEGSAPLSPPVPGDNPLPLNHVPDRGQPMPSQLFVLLALAAVVLIGFSVLGTVYLLRRPAAPAVTQTPVASTPQEKPAAVSPITPVPAATQLAVSTPPSEPEKLPPPAATISTPAAALPSAAPVTAALQPPALVIASTPLDPTKPDPKILAYIDAVQIAGVRISGNSGKVLMNDHVFRENDIVDHLLGLRLKKIADDSLTFVDERGVTYTKNF